MKKIPLRIISGRLKNQTFYSYSESTRETASIIRGAVFNMLFQISGVGLDLFAGSGAYGFEAYSRGLSKVYLNDMNQTAYKGLLENQKKLKTSAIITNFDYTKAIAFYLSQNIKFDYIFLDPPYDMLISPIIDSVKPLLSNKGKLICEVEKNQEIVCDLELLKTRIHGIKKINIYEKND